MQTTDKIQVNDLSQYLVEFFSVAATDPRITPVHISLYVALLTVWSERHFEEPLCIFGREIMPFAKISSVATYHKAIRDLQKYGHLEYVPSYNHFLGSLVFLTKLNLSIKQ